MQKFYLAALVALTWVFSPAFAEVAEPSRAGPFPIQTIVDGVKHADYSSAVVYLPKGSGPFPAISLTPGYTNAKERITWLGQRLASHGIISIVFTPKNIYSLDPRNWSKGHIAALEILERENQDLTSPLAQKLNPGQLGIAGYSFGGAGALIAAEELDSKIKALALINPYRPINAEIPASTLFISGNQDYVAYPSAVLASFEGMQTDFAKAYAEINGMGHLEPLSGTTAYHDDVSTLVVSWLKYFLAGEAGYETYFNGPKLEEMKQKGSFAKADDYIFLGAP